jgi:hypothetical protein
MEGFLKQSTAVNITVLMIDSTDHITGKTGLTLTIYATKAAGTPAVITPTVTELDSTNVKGVYKLALTSSHTDTLGELQLHITATGADPSDVKWQVSANLMDDLNTKLDTIDDFLDTEIAAIKAKTDNLPGDPADASDIAASFTTVNTKLDTIDDFLDTEVAAIKAKTDNLSSDPADASDIAASFSTVNTKLDTIDDFIDTEIAAIKAKTDNLPASPANESTLITIASYIDTEVAAIKAKTDNLPAAPAAVGDIPTANQNADALLDRAAGVETGVTPRQGLRLMLAAMVGKLSGAATTNILIRDTGDSKDRINATVDADGNRSAVTLDSS